MNGFNHLKQEIDLLDASKIDLIPMLKESIGKLVEQDDRDFLYGNLARRSVRLRSMENAATIVPLIHSIGERLDSYFEIAEQLVSIQRLKQLRDLLDTVHHDLDQVSPGWQKADYLHSESRLLNTVNEAESSYAAIKLAVQNSIYGIRSDSPSDQREGMRSFVSIVTEWPAEISRHELENLIDQIDDEVIRYKCKLEVDRRFATNNPK